MFDFLSDWFSTSGFMPHGHCYLWKPALVWLQVSSNLAIALSYFAITGTLLYLVRRVRNMPFQWVYLAFAVFIVACGCTHLFDVYTVWTPAYWADGSVRAVTAGASLGTAVLLPSLIPKVMALSQATALAQTRGVELERANQELARLLENSNELERLKTQFFANVSHELRTPLTLVLGPAERQLAGADLSPELRRDFELIARNARTVLRHVNDLLDLSKLEAGRAKPEYSSVDLSNLLQLTASQFEQLVTERALTFSLLTPQELRAEVDANQVERILVNLLTNAFKFTPVGGQIGCSLSKHSSAPRACIEVTDSGPGIPVDQREHIFERFNQLEGGSTRKLGGTGLGLAIVRELVALHGGSITVDVAPEGGALFRVELPLHAPSHADVRQHSRALDDKQLSGTVAAVDDLRTRPATEAQREQLDGAPLALVVEDNPDMAHFIVQTLSTRYRTAVASDGRQGLAQALRLMPDVIISDMMMPELSGDQLVRNVRADATLDGIPILILTAKADDELRVQLLRAGAQDYVTKPFAAEELLARVANWVQVKLTREVLQRELRTSDEDIAALAGKLAQRQRELSTALEAMSLARAHAQSAGQFKSNFLNLVSHELRTPLSALTLQVERLRRESADSASARLEIVERMSGTLARLVTLIESLLEYSRIDRGRLVANVQDFDVRALLQEVADEYRSYAEQKGIHLRLAAESEDPRMVRSDPRLLRLVLVNLVSNAIKFTDSGGVDLHFEERDGMYRFGVVDTGRGVAPEHRVRIFEPFEQLEVLSNKHGPGVGLGLALVRQIVNAMGGRIELHSSPGRGSTFVAAVPRVDA